MSERVAVLRSIAVACDPLADIADYIERVEGQRDELLAACQALLDWYDRDGSVGGIVDPIEDVRAAVNKATGAPHV
jgi:hypothetical protein